MQLFIFVHYLRQIQLTSHFLPQWGPKERLTLLTLRFIIYGNNLKLLPLHISTQSLSDLSMGILMSVSSLKAALKQHASPLCSAQYSLCEQWRVCVSCH